MGREAGEETWDILWSESECLTCGQKVVFPVILHNGFMLFSMMSEGPEKDELYRRHLAAQYRCPCTGQYRIQSAKMPDGTIPVMDDRSA